MIVYVSMEIPCSSSTERRIVMHLTKLLAIGAVITALGAPAFAAPPPPYVNPPKPQKEQVSRASQLNKSDQIDAFQRKDAKLRELIKDLEAGRPVDPQAITRALE